MLIASRSSRKNLRASVVPTCTRSYTARLAGIRSRSPTSAIHTHRENSAKQQMVIPEHTAPKRGGIMKTRMKRAWSAAGDRRGRAIVAVSLLLLLALLVLPVAAQVGGGYDLSWNSVDGG